MEIFLSCFVVFASIIFVLVCVDLLFEIKLKKDKLKDKEDKK